MVNKRDGPIRTVHIKKQSSRQQARGQFHKVEQTALSLQCPTFEKLFWAEKLGIVVRHTWVDLFE